MWVTILTHSRKVDGKGGKSLLGLGSTMTLGEPKCILEHGLAVRDHACSKAEAGPKKGRKRTWRLLGLHDRHGFHRLRRYLLDFLSGGLTSKQ